MNFLHSFHPAAIALHVGVLTIYWYGIIIASAVLIGFFLTLHIAKKKQIKADHVYNLLFWLIIFGLIGGRIANILVDWGYFRLHQAEIIKIWHGGLAIHGVVFAGLLTVLVYARVKKISGWLLTDVLVVALPLMQAIGRWGNYFNQELFGQPSALPWAIPISPAQRPVGLEEAVYYHPLFLYESLLMLVAFAVLFYLWRRNSLKLGRLTLLYFMFFAAIRFSLDFLRINPPAWGFLTVAQWLSLVLFLGAILLWRPIKKLNTIPDLQK